VIAGPFAETKELVAGFWLWEVKSMEDANFGAELTPELREQEERLRAQMAETR